jgi:hypothetical protein
MIVICDHDHFFVDSMYQKNIEFEYNKQRSIDNVFSFINKYIMNQINIIISQIDELNIIYTFNVLASSDMYNIHDV